jgi:hypothetical protein
MQGWGTGEDIGRGSFEDVLEFVGDRIRRWHGRSVGVLKQLHEACDEALEVGKPVLVRVEESLRPFGERALAAGASGEPSFDDFGIIKNKGCARGVRLFEALAADVNLLGPI